MAPPTTDFAAHVQDCYSECADDCDPDLCDTSGTYDDSTPGDTVQITEDDAARGFATTIANNTEMLKGAFKSLGLVTSVDAFTYDQSANTISVALQTKYGPPIDGEVRSFQQTSENDFAWDSIYSDTSGFPFWSDDLINGDGHQPIPVEWLPSLHITLDGTYNYECGPQVLVDFQNQDAGRIQFNESCIID